MKTSELIKVLQGTLEKYGDVEVAISTDGKLASHIEGIWPVWSRFSDELECIVLENNYIKYDKTRSIKRVK